MALTKTFYKTQPGFTGELIASNAYWKVINVSGNKDAVSARVAAFVADSPVHEMSIGFSPDQDNFNFIRQAYEYLKTLPEFAGATDC
jgi:hypothetical protein